MRAGAGSSLEGVESGPASPCWQGPSRCAPSLGARPLPGPSVPAPSPTPSPRAQGRHSRGPLPGASASCPALVPGRRGFSLRPAHQPRPSPGAWSGTPALFRFSALRGCLGPWRGRGGPAHSAVGTLAVGRTPRGRWHVPAHHSQHLPSGLPALQFCQSLSRV